MNINIHIDINMNIDIHIIINMNNICGGGGPLPVPIIYSLLAIPLFLFPSGMTIGLPPGRTPVPYAVPYMYLLTP